MLSCFAAKKMGASHTVARVRNSEYNTASWGFMKEQLEISMAVNPEKLADEAIFDTLKLPSATKVETLYSLFGGNAEALEFNVESDFEYTETPLKKLEIKSDVLLAGITRENIAFIPGGDDVIHAGDKVIVIAKGERLCNLSDILKRK